MHIVEIDDAHFVGLIVQEYIFGDTHIGNQIHFLMNTGNAGFFYFTDGLKTALFAFKFYGSFISSVRINATDDLDQRGFTRSVFTHQRMYVTALYVKGYFGQRFYAGENFCYILQLQNIISHSYTSISISRKGKR